MLTLIAWIFLLIYAALIQSISTQTVFRYHCPHRCSCVPDNAELLKISCKWQKLQTFNENFPKNVTKTLTIQCENEDAQNQQNEFIDGMFTGFQKIEKLKILHCKTNVLKAEMFYGLENLRELHLLNIESAPLTLGKNSLSQLKLLERLSIIDSGLERVENSALCSLKYLQILNVSENRLQNVGINVDREDCILDHLIIYDITGNKVEQLSSTDLNTFPSIRQLKLSANRLKRIQNDAFKSSNLMQHLELSNNELKEMVPLPDSIIHINLAQNRLTTIPASVANLLSLVFLNISGNLIDSTTPFSLLSTSIETLDLSNNLLSEIPLKLFRESVDTITILSLAQNNITEIQPHFLRNFTRLKELDLSKNLIKSLPYGIFHGLNELSNLLINDNLIYHVDIEVFNDLGKKLTTLNMANNQLVDLPMAISRLGKIKEINFSGNKINTAYIFVLNKLTHLTTLELADNDLQKIESYIFSDSPQLSEINLKGNKITTINDDAFEKCPKLSKINLADNRIIQLGNSLKSINSLKFLNISNNQLKMLNWEILPTGINELYAKNNLIQSITKVVESSVKVMNLGNNRLQSIESEQLPHLLEEIDLHGNELQQISKHSFTGKSQLKLINVQNNSLKTIPAGLFDQSEVVNKNVPGKLYIEGNPLICNCEMAWIINATLKNLAVQIVNIENSKCILPLTNRLVPMNNISEDDYLCRYNKSCEPGCVCCQFGNCDCKSKCPENCECFRDNNYKTNIVKCHLATGQKVSVRELPMYASHIYLDNANLPVLRSHDFIGRTRLSHLHITSSGLHTIEPVALNTLPKLKVLNLFGNSLQKINGDESFKTLRIQKLNIEHNNIAEIDERLAEIMPNLEVLHAADNSMKELPDYLTTETANNKLKAVSLSGNPFRCDCSITRGFKIQEWFQQNRGRTLDAEKVHCVENITEALSLNDSTVLTTFAPNIDGDLFTIPIMEFLYHENRSLCMVKAEGFFGGTTKQNILLVSFVAVVIIIIITGVFYVLLSAFKNKNDKTCSSQTRFRMTSSVTSSADQGYSPLPSEMTNQYDIFISYSKDDEQFVLQELCRPLEHRGLTLSLLHREGKFNYNNGLLSISDELNRQVQRCQTMIMFISERFLQREWKTTQIQTSHHLFNKTANKKLIAVLSPEINTNEVSPELGKILLHNTRIWQNDPLFWNLLMSKIMQRDSPRTSESSQDYSGTYDTVPSVYV